MSKTLDKRSTFIFAAYCTEQNWAHPKATTLPRICKSRNAASFVALFFSKTPIWGHFGVYPTSLYVRTIRFPTFCRSMSSVGVYSQYPAWLRCRRSADVPRAEHDRVGWSPWQGGVKERDTRNAIFPFVWFFRHLKLQPSLSSSSTKDHWCDRPFLAKNNSLPLLMMQIRQDTHPAIVKLRP